jgi:hypothetical protein
MARTWETRLALAALAAVVTIIALAIAMRPFEGFLAAGDRGLVLDAVSVTPTSATVSARIDGMDMATEAFVQYGRTSRYGRCSHVEPIPRDGHGVRTSFVLAPLRSGTTYHYRVVVLGGRGLAYDTSADLTLRPTSGSVGDTLHPETGPTGDLPVQGACA